MMTERMSSQLKLPSAALLVPTHGQLHVDSEEAIQYERRRVSRELEPIQPHGSGKQSAEAPRNSESQTSLRSRTASQELLRRHPSVEDDPSTQPDVQDSSEEQGSQSIRSFLNAPQWHDPITKFWNAHISITIDEGAHRDHLALERTFLGYLRTSLIFVMTGVLTAQLFRLQRSANPNPGFGFYIIGRPLSILFMGMGLVVVLVGAFRFWKLQNALVRGKACTGGWEVLLIMGLSVLLLAVTFALVLGVTIDKAMKEG